MVATGHQSRLPLQVEFDVEHKMVRYMHVSHIDFIVLCHPEGCILIDLSYLCVYGFFPHVVAILSVEPECMPEGSGDLDAKFEAGHTFSGCLESLLDTFATVGEGMVGLGPAPVRVILNAALFHIFDEQLWLLHP